MYYVNLVAKSSSTDTKKVLTKEKILFFFYWMIFKNIFGFFQRIVREGVGGEHVFSSTKPTRWKANRSVTNWTYLKPDVVKSPLPENSPLAEYNPLPAIILFPAP